jgi:hypothetical protein
MPRVDITVPGPNEVVMPGKPFSVAGVVHTRGMPEPITIDSVIVRGAGPPITAQMSSNPPQFATVNYSAQATISGEPGSSDTILVTATDENGLTGSRSVTVFIGQGPFNTTFTGTSTVKTTYGRAAGPFVMPFSIGLQFSADRKTVSVTSFPPIVTSTSRSGATITVTVTQTGGGTGVFDATTGTITAPITLSFHVVVTYMGITIHDGTSTLTLILSTGTETSPSGAFTDTGEPLQPNGAITVVGDGTFSGDLLGGSDASLVLAGTVSPHP